MNLQDMKTNEPNKRAYHSPRIQVCQMEMGYLLQDASKTITEGGNGSGPSMGKPDSGNLIPAKQNTGWFNWDDEAEE